MSSQQDIGEKGDQRLKQSGGKKRHGKFEVWVKWSKRNREDGRWRTYETRELAEKNAAEFFRKWNSGSNDDPMFFFYVKQKGGHDSRPK